MKNQWKPLSKYKICSTLEQIERVIKYCNKTKYASIDFETKATGPHGPVRGEDEKTPTGPQYREDEPTGLGISFQPGSAYFIPLYHKDSPFSRTEARSILDRIGKRIMGNPTICKIAWNFKFEYRWFLRYGWTSRGILLDGMLAKYLLNEERPHGLKEFVEEHFPHWAGYEDAIKEERRKNGGEWGNIPIPVLGRYCCLDCDLTFRATLFLEKLCIKNGFYRLLRSMCMMQTRVLAESEHMGALIDKGYLESIISRQQKEIDLNLEKLLGHKAIRRFQRNRIKSKIKDLILTMQEEIADLRKEAKKTNKDVTRLVKNREEKISRYIAGQLVTKKEVVGQVNFNSPDQMVDLLFTDMGFDFDIVKFTKDDRKQDTDRPSTDEEVLLELQKKDKTGFITQLLKHREMTKLFSTYMVAPHYRLTETYTLHTSYLIHGTVTGRLSSKNINMQNIPRDTTSSLIKRMFIPPPGHLMFEVDYGQAELRVVAEAANCKGLIQIFRDGYNVHLATGLKIVKQFHRYEEIKKLLKDFNHPDHTKWEKVKKAGKVLNFSILYLQSDEMTAGQLGSSVKQAAKFKAEWFAAFPEIKIWMDNQERHVRKYGFVYNIFGRKRRLPDIYSPNKGTVNKAIRDSVNAPIQGASSDFTQLSCIVLRDMIKRGDLILTDNPKYKSQTYTVHDSIGFYIEPKYIATAVPIIERVCSDPETFRYFGFRMKHVKMKVSAEVGQTWGSLQDYIPGKDYLELLEDNKKLYTDLKLVA